VEWIQGALQNAKVNCWNEVLPAETDFLRHEDCPLHHVLHNRV
jgi:hypothetical protein